MKKLKPLVKNLRLFIGPLIVLLLFSCSKTDESEVINPNIEGSATEIPIDPERVDFVLNSANGSGVGGVASFIPNDDGSTTVYIQLENASSGRHPATINFGSVEDGGTIAISLTTCTCAISVTTITELDNGNSISFVDLMKLDAHLNIYESLTDGTIIAQTNIGANAF